MKLIERSDVIELFYKVGVELTAQVLPGLGHRKSQYSLLEIENTLNGDVEAGLEYIKTAGFVEREIPEDRERTYPLTHEAERYLKEYRGRTSRGD